MDVLNALVMVAPAVGLVLLLSSSFRAVLRRALVRHFAEPLRAALRSRMHVEKLVDLVISLGSLGAAIGAVLGLNDQQTLLLAVAWGLVSWLLVIRLLRLVTELEKEEDKQRHRRTAGTVRSIVTQVLGAASPRKISPSRRRSERKARGYSPARSGNALKVRRRVPKMRGGKPWT